MPARANLGRTAHICDLVARRNNSQIKMVVISGADRVCQGRVRRPSLGSSCRGETLRLGGAAASAAQRHSTLQREVGNLAWLRRSRICRAAASSENPPLPPLPKEGPRGSGSTVWPWPAGHHAVALNRHLQPIALRIQHHKLVITIPGPARAVEDRQAVGLHLGAQGIDGRL